MKNNYGKTIIAGLDGFIGNGVLGSFLIERNTSLPVVNNKNGRLHMFLPFFLSLLFVALPASAQQPTWYILAREDGCHDLQLLVRAFKLSRAPVSPEDFAQMMRERGDQVSVGPLADSPPELIGKVVQVKVGNEKAPIFVKKEICRTIDQGR